MRTKKKWKQREEWKDFYWKLLQKLEIPNEMKMSGQEQQKLDPKA